MVGQVLFSAVPYQMFLGDYDRAMFKFYCQQVEYNYNLIIQQAINHGYSEVDET